MPNVPERCCNRLVNARIQKKKLATLRKRLKAVRSSVDNSSPASFGLPHLSRNLKKAQMLEDEYQRIEHQNRVLLHRMSRIMDNPSRTTDNHSNFHKYSRSLNIRRRKANRDRITVANGHLLHQLKTTDPYYRITKWEQDHARSHKIMKQLMEHDYKAPAKPRKVRTGELLPDEYTPRAGPGYHQKRAQTSPRRLKKLSQKGKAKRKKARQGLSVDDEVVEIFRFPCLELDGLSSDVPSTTWDISLLDSRAAAEHPNTSLLLLRGNKVSRDAVTTLPLTDDYISQIIDGNAELEKVFKTMRRGVRAYKALGLLSGNAELATQFANLLLSKTRVTGDLKFKLVFEQLDDGLDDMTQANAGVALLEAEAQAEAAEVIQAVVRGRQARSRVAVKKEQAAASDPKPQDGSALSSCAFYEKGDAGTPSAAWTYRGPVAEQQARAQYSS